MSSEVNDPQLDRLNQQIQTIDEQLKKPLPTAAVGTTVWWFARGERGPGREVAAMVTRVEAPGQVKLTVFADNSHPTHLQGVLHESHPTHLNRGNSSTVKNGCWTFINDKPATIADKQLHVDALNKRREAVYKEYADYKQARARKEEAAEAVRKLQETSKT